MTKALISIDYTVDFVADEGKLTAGAPAQAISESIAQVTKLAFDQGAYVFFAIDAHDVDDPFHPESKLFPPHNIIGLVDGICMVLSWFLSGAQSGSTRLLDGQASLFCFFRNWSGYPPPGTWRRYGYFDGSLNGHLCLHTAVDAYNLGYQIEVVAPAVASLTPENHQFALNHFKHVLGAKVVNEQLEEL